MKNQKVSIIIPSYNSAAYIQETIDSVLGQTHNNLEIIVVDDASTDNTLEVLQKYAEQIKILALPHNQFVSKARMAGAAEATGEYLLFLDSDDRIHRDYLKLAVEVMQQNPQISVVYSRAKYFGSKNREWKLPAFQVQDFLLTNSVFMPALIRKAAYDKTGGFDQSLSMFEDWELFIQILRNGGQFYKIDQVLFYYRKRKDASSITDYASRNPEQISQNYLKIYLKHYPFYIENGIYMQDLMSYKQYKNKYYNTWYKKLFYTIKPKKQTKQ